MKIAAILMVFICVGLVISSCDLNHPKSIPVENRVVHNISEDRVSFPDYHMFGVAYYPEQSDTGKWDDDFKKMSELGFNVVRMGEFAWSSFEPAENKFDFHWMDKAIDLAARHGIKTILCTPTAAVPPWLRKKYPEVLGANSKGDFTYGARKGYNVNSKKYIEASQKITSAMAVHYADNPNIIGWQLDNEPGYPFELYDEVSLHLFQDWLRHRYGTIGRLNRAWYSAFWNLNYSAWDQIEFPTNTGDGGWNPGERLDYRRFFSYAFQNHLAIQAGILRKFMGSRFIYTNWPNTYWSVDVFDTGNKILDATAWDNYSSMPGLSSPDDYYAALNDDICRCAGPNQRFFISERPTQVPAHIPLEAFRTHFYRDLAHGSSGSIFFEWKPPVGGQELGYVSVLQRDGSFGPAKEQYIRISQELKKIETKLMDTKTESDIALIYSYQNQWEQGFWQGSAGYDAVAAKYYLTLKMMNRNIDVIPEYKSLKNYKIIAAPGLRMISDQTYARLEHWVGNGGILILDKTAGVRDTLNRYRELISPGVFQKMAGIRIYNSSSKRSMSGNLMMGKDNQLQNLRFGIKFLNNNCEFEPESIIQALTLEGAEPVAKAYGAELTGKCAISLNHYGKGYVVYVGTDSSDLAFYQCIGKLIRDRFNVKPILSVPYGCEVVSRVKNKEEYIFVLNNTLKKQTLELPQPMVEMLSGLQEEKTVTIAPLDVKIFIR